MVDLCAVMKQRYGIEINEEQCKLLLGDLYAIMRINETMNLTRIVSEDAGVILHLEDSLSALNHMNEAPDGLYGDLGTGGGFPGIPLAIMSGRETVLIDSVQKKVRAVESAAHDLGLAHVEGYAGRIEDLAKERKGQFAVLTARAVSSLSSLMELAVPLLKKGGRLICYKAQPTDEEVSDALKLQGLLEMYLIKKEEFELSDGSRRCLFVFEKKDKPHISLPRRVGLAQKQPLKR